MTPTPVQPDQFNGLDDDRPKGLATAKRPRTQGTGSFPIIFHVAAWLLAVNLAGTWAFRAFSEVTSYLEHQSARRAYQKADEEYMREREAADRLKDGRR